MANELGKDERVTKSIAGTSAGTVFNLWECIVGGSLRMCI